MFPSLKEVKTAHMLIKEARQHPDPVLRKSLYEVSIHYLCCALLVVFAKLLIMGLRLTLLILLCVLAIVAFITLSQPVVVDASPPPRREVSTINYKAI